MKKNKSLYVDQNIQAKVFSSMPEKYIELQNFHAERKQSPKALFICPPDIYSGVFPFGFSQMVSIAKKHKFDVSLLDYTNRGFNRDMVNEIEKKVKQDEIDILCLTGYSHNYQFIKAAADAAKRANDRIYIMTGGYWSRWSPEFALKNTQCDLVATGEGEVVFNEICQLWPNIKSMHSLLGIAVRHNQEIFKNGTAPTSPLDNLAMPEYELFDFTKHYIYKDKDTGKVSCSMSTSRGCSAHCSFCTGANQTYRPHPIERILKEILYVKKTYGVEKLFFKDALTIIKSPHCKKLFKAIGDANLGLNFEIVARVDSIDEEMIKLLKRAGVGKIQIGVESGDDDLLKTMIKGNSVNQVKFAIKLCQENDIDIAGGFIVGMPGETIKSLVNTLIFALNNRIAGTGVTFPVPFPGTDLYEIAKTKLNLTEEDVLLDPIFRGGGVYGQTYEQSLKYLHKFHLSDVSPYWLLFFNRILHRPLGISHAFMKKRYLYGYLKVILFFFLFVPTEFAKMIFYRFYLGPKQKVDQKYEVESLPFNPDGFSWEG
jgi:anaerobic magnesium-protoporphyrin IX monomethyl ester cyclase